MESKTTSPDVSAEERRSREKLDAIDAQQEQQHQEQAQRGKAWKAEVLKEAIRTLSSKENAPLQQFCAERGVDFGVGFDAAKANALKAMCVGGDGSEQ